MFIKIEDYRFFYFLYFIIGFIIKKKTNTKHSNKTLHTPNFPEMYFNGFTGYLYLNKKVHIKETAYTVLSSLNHFMYYLSDMAKICICSSQATDLLIKPTR